MSDAVDDQELERLRAQLAAAQEEIERLRSARPRTDRGAELLHDVETEQLRAERDAYRYQLEAVYRSETWRIGRAVLTVPRVASRAVRKVAVARDRKSRRRAPLTARVARRNLRRAGLHIDYPLVEADGLRAGYEQALERREHHGDGRKIVFAVSTTQLDEGRGDVYTAVGLGRWLERRGCSVVYLEPDRWYDVPDDTDVYVSMLMEPERWVNPLRLPASCLRVAWIRNATRRWIDTGTLPAYDGVLCTSERTRREIATAYPGPLGILRIAVDHELFTDHPASTQRRGVVTTVNRWSVDRELFSVLAGGRIDFPLALFGNYRGLAPSVARHARGLASYFALPSLYRQAAVVLDDQQDVNRPFGNINSRVYESLACGSLPITNGRLGLDEVGLEQLPTYQAPEDLFGHIRRYLTDEGARAQVVEPLKARVLSDHTYERRAAELDAFVDGIASGADTGRDLRAVIGFSPDYRHTNTYQSLLYSSAGDHGVIVLPAATPAAMTGARSVGSARRVFHLHWTAPILGPARDARDANRRADGFLAELDAFRNEGGVVVWTVHNVLPHECSHPDVERRLRQGIADRADAVHVMCNATVQLVRGVVTLPEDRVHVIPHCSYVDVYPNVITPQAARARLGLGEHDLVYAFVGGIRPYKGVDALIDAFETVSAGNPNARLIVAGAPGRFRQARDLQRRCEDHPAVVSRFERIPDEELQIYLNAADVVVLPSESVLNSGSLELAFTFARPVIAANVGCVAEIMTPDLGIAFDPKPRALVDAMLDAERLTDESHRKAALQHARAVPFTAMSDAFMALLMRFVEKVEDDAS